MINRYKKSICIFLSFIMLFALPFSAMGASHEGTVSAGDISQEFKEYTVSADISCAASVTYNGKKHVPIFVCNGVKQVLTGKVKRGTVRDLEISISGNILDIAIPAYRIKNNKNSSTESLKKPFVTVGFKPKKGITAQQRAMVRAENKKWKDNPFGFIIDQADLGKLPVEYVLGGKDNSKVKKVTVSFDGVPLKLSKKDYTAEVVGDIVTITGRNNFRGVYSNVKKEEKKKEPIDDTDVAEDTGLRKTFSALSMGLMNSSEISGQVKSGNNVAVSAYSIENAMGMTANGAKGDTLSEMEQVLFGGESIDTFNEQIGEYNSFVSSLNGEGFITNLANGIWVNNRPINKDFEKIVTDTYKAMIKGDAFNQGTPGEINRFVSENTHGKINEIVGDLDDDVRIVLVNALYLEGVWNEDFSEDNIVEKQKFTDSTGKVSEVTMLRDNESCTYFSYKGADGIMRSLKDGKGKFVAILPPEDMEVADFLKMCNGNTMACIEAGIDRKCELFTMFPEFEYSFDTNLVDPLSELGIKAAFGGNADLTGMLENEPTYISDIFHKTYVQVDRNGAKAAAATAVVGKTTSAGGEVDRKVVIFDRPFIYMLTDGNNMPLFVGVVNKV